MATEVTPFTFQGEAFYVKRDELIDPLLSGNKFRKLYTLVQTPAEKYRKLISYGGTQSNAMLSIAALCNRKNWEFHYYAKPVPEQLKKHLSGNLKMALELGMKLHEVPHDAYEKTIAQLKQQLPPQALFIPQGGADPIARQGIAILAEEIREWQLKQGISSLNIVTPAGTGTTAFYLARTSPYATVYTAPIVGDRHYLQEQMQQLGEIPANLQILQPAKKYHFARPYPELLAMYSALKEAGIEFDLIYGVGMWLTLIRHMQTIHGTVLYVHSGGLPGNPSMVQRYEHKGITVSG